MRAYLLSAFSLSLFAVCAIAPPAAARPDAPGTQDIYKYATGDKVESFPSQAGGGGHFRVHFTRAGASAVPAADANANNVPDHVEEVAALYEEVYTFYTGTLGFRAPVSDASTPGNNGGDGRFDVYLLDFALKADGTFVRERCNLDVCSGYMVQENDFAGYSYPSATIGNRILSSHEFFHAVQAAYDANQGSIASEGTAVWATEKFDPSLSDFEGFLRGFLDRPDRSLDIPLPGPVDPFSYGAALFFQFLDEHVGKDVIRRLWEDLADGARGVDDPQWFTALAALLKRDLATSFAAELLTFAEWNLFTNKRADSTRSYAAGKGYPLVKMTLADAPYKDDLLRVFYSSAQYLSLDPGTRTSMTAHVSSTMDLSTLRLGLAVRRGDKISAPVRVPLPPSAPEGGTLPTVDTTGADALIVYVVNTAQSGESTRGRLCIGSPAEVDACRPAPQSPDMAEMPLNPMPEGGCSVSAAAARRSPPGLALAALLALTAIAAARRRR